MIESPDSLFISSAFFSATRFATSVVENVDCFSIERRMPSSPSTFVNVSALLSVISTRATSQRRTSSTPSSPSEKSFTFFSSSRLANLSPTRTIYWFSLAS